MKKPLHTFSLLFLLAVGLVALEITTHDYIKLQPGSAKELSASIIERAQESQDITLALLKEAGVVSPGISKKSSTQIFLDHVQITPLEAHKREIRSNNKVIATVYEIEDAKNYALLLTESYNQQNENYQVSENSKNSFLLETAEIKQKHFVTQAKDTIIGIEYDGEYEQVIIHILASLGFETP